MTFLASSTNLMHWYGFFMWLTWYIPLIPLVSSFRDACLACTTWAISVNTSSYSINWFLEPSVLFSPFANTNDANAVIVGVMRVNA